MKKLLLSIFSGVVMCCPCKAAHIIIEKHHSGPKGCKSLLESHGDDGYHELVCIDSGYSTYKFDDQSAVIYTISPAGASFNLNQYVIPQVEREISKLNMAKGDAPKGKFYLTPDILVEWFGADTNNYSIRIQGDFKVAG